MSFQPTNNQTNDLNVELQSIRRILDQNAANAALHPTYEGNTYIEPSRTLTDYVYIIESTDPTQG